MRLTLINTTVVLAGPSFFFQPKVDKDDDFSYFARDDEEQYADGDVDGVCTSLAWNQAHPALQILAHA